MENLKKCFKCSQWKNRSEFTYRKKAKDKLYGVCRKCNNQRVMEKYWRKQKSDPVWIRKQLEIKNRLIEIQNHPGMKKCSRCKEWKLKNKFHKDKSQKDNLEYICKICGSNRQKSLRRQKKIAENPQLATKYLELQQREIISIICPNFKQCDCCRKWKEKCQFWKKKKGKDGLSNWCKKCMGEKRRKDYQVPENKTKIKEEVKKYNQRPDAKEKRNKRKRKRYRMDIRYRLRKNMSGMIHQRLKQRLLSKNGKPTFDFLPYTVDELKKHLESLWEPWMNWDNYGNRPGCWSIDHKIPDSHFHYISVEDPEFQKCWALENLQPMEWYENCFIKRDKIIY